MGDKSRCGLFTHEATVQFTHQLSEYNCQEPQHGDRAAWRHEEAKGSTKKETDRANKEKTVRDICKWHSLIVMATIRQPTVLWQKV